MKQKEFFDLADEMEKACGDWENSEGMSEESLKSLMAKVEKMDGGRKRFRLKKRYILILAATLALLMGTGVAGNRAWISKSNDLERESEVTTKVDNEDKEDIQLEEEAIYQEIGEKLGISSIRLGHMPDGMVLDSYTVMENTGWACVNYLYNDTLISVKMAKITAEFSSNVQWDGTSRRLENISNVYGYMENIEAYCVDETYGNYAACITYGNGYYNIFGTFSSEEDFLEILSRIYFKTL